MYLLLANSRLTINDFADEMGISKGSVHVEVYFRPLAYHILSSNNTEMTALILCAANIVSKISLD